MRRERALVLAVLAAVLAVGESRDLQQSGNGRATVTGKATFLSMDFEGSSKRYFVVQTENGGKVLVQPEDASQLDDIQSGDDVRVTGDWYLPPTAQGNGPPDGIPPGLAKPNGVGNGLAALADDEQFGCMTTSECMRRAAVVKSKGRARSVPEATYTFVDLPTDFPVSGPAVSNTPYTADVKTLFIPIVPMTSTGAYCPGTQAPVLTKDQIRAKVFPELGAPVSVGGLFSRCSFTRTKLNTGSSVVTDYVRIPCSGTSTGGAWGFSSCTNADINGWADAANAVLKSQGVVNPDNYPYKVYMIPPGVCSWVGLGYVGCDGSYECRTWIADAFWGTTQAVFHELGHNLFLDHATTAGNTYGDLSCAMGACCNDRCFNTPHAFQLGWISALTVDNVNLPANGLPVYFSIYSQSVTPNPAAIRIDTSTFETALARSVAPIFIGYRTAVNYDTLLDSMGLADEVHVYHAQITYPKDAVQTLFRGSLLVGQSMNIASAGITITRVASSYPDTASVSIRRVAV